MFHLGVSACARGVMEDVIHTQLHLEPLFLLMSYVARLLRFLDALLEVRQRVHGTKAAIGVAAHRIKLVRNERHFWSSFSRVVSVS